MKPDLVDTAFTGPGVPALIPCEVGTVDRFVIHRSAPVMRDVVISPVLKPPDDVQRTLSAYAQARQIQAGASKREQRAARTAHERATAYALQQPQGLGLLFPGLRPKAQR